MMVEGTFDPQEVLDLIDQLLVEPRKYMSEMEAYVTRAQRAVVFFREWIVEIEAIRAGIVALQNKVKGEDDV
jgi:hypothetical protein